MYRNERCDAVYSRKTIQKLDQKSGIPNIEEGRISCVVECPLKTFVFTKQGTSTFEAINDANTELREYIQTNCPKVSLITTSGDIPQDFFPKANNY